LHMLKIYLYMLKDIFVYFRKGKRRWQPGCFSALLFVCLGILSYMVTTLEW
jgi:hypothetical protein